MEEHVDAVEGAVGGEEVHRPLRDGPQLGGEEARGGRGEGGRTIFYY